MQLVLSYHHVQEASVDTLTTWSAEAKIIFASQSKSKLDFRQHSGRVGPGKDKTFSLKIALGHLYWDAMTLHKYAVLSMLWLVEAKLWLVEAKLHKIQYASPGKMAYSTTFSAYEVL